MEGEVLRRDSVIEMRNEKIIQMQKELVVTKEQLKIAMHELKELEFQKTEEKLTAGFEPEVSAVSYE